jgi:adenylate cyclase
MRNRGGELWEVLMRFGKQNVKGWQLTRRQRRLGQAALVGLAVAALVSLTLWAGLFASVQTGAADYLYETDGDPGDDIVIVAIDEKTQQQLGEEWPFLSLAHYAQAFGRLKGAKVVGFDVMLSNPALEGDPDMPMLLEAIRQAGNVIMPLDAVEVFVPDSPGELYSVGQIIQPLPVFSDAAANVGSVKVVLDGDGTLRRIPLLAHPPGGETWKTFSLQVLRLFLDLGAAPVSLVGDHVIIGDDTEIKYQVRTDANGAMLVNFVGRPNTFPSYSFIDVIKDQVPSSLFEGKIVLVGTMDLLTEMDLHLTPVSPKRMSGVEFLANAIHTLLNHSSLAQQGKVETTITVVLLALVSAVVLSQLGVVLGVIFTLLLAVGYWVFTYTRFDANYLPNVLFPYAAIFINYAVVTATRFASERGERRQVSDTFGRFVSAEVRDMIVNAALEDPDLIQPGGQQMEISVLFADIRGFTTISEQLPPSEVVEVLNQYLDSMEEEVFKQGGTLDKYTGDGMMVIFGAPLEQPDHAERAVQAALGMQQAAAEVSRQRGGTLKLVYGIGIATGPAVVGHIGSKRRLDYTAIGDTVNLAARLEGKAPPGTILVNQTAFEAIQDIAVVDALEPMMVKGKAKPVVVYKVLRLQKGIG